MNWEERIPQIALKIIEIATCECECAKARKTRASERASGATNASDVTPTVALPLKTYAYVYYVLSSRSKFRLSGRHLQGCAGKGEDGENGKLMHSACARCKRRDGFRLFLAASGK